MGGYVDIAGHPTWTTELGSGAETVLLLHGGLSCSDLLLDSIGVILAERYRVAAFDRRGHGRTADSEAPFHYEDMADEAIAVIEDVVGGRTHVVGWSDGGIVGLLVARRRPDLVDRLVAIGANYRYEGNHEMGQDDEPSPAMQRIASDYAERSPDGPGHFDVVLQKTFAMFATEPTLTVDDLRGVVAPTLVLVGDDDLPMLTHTVSLYEALPAGQLAVLPGASHFVILERPAQVASLIIDFLGQEQPPKTLMPFLRR